MTIMVKVRNMWNFPPSGSVRNLILPLTPCVGIVLVVVGVRVVGVLGVKLCVKVLAIGPGLVFTMW